MGLSTRYIVGTLEDSADWVQAHGGQKSRAPSTGHTEAAFRVMGEGYPHGWRVEPSPEVVLKDPALGPLRPILAKACDTLWDAVYWYAAGLCRRC